MVFNEAKVLGLPIVSTNFGSAYEFLKNGIDGIITDLDSIEEVLMSLLGNSDEYNSLNKGVKAVSYSNTPIIQRLNELFQVA